MADLYSLLLVDLEATDVPGEYDDDVQTWSEIVDAQLSPVKHHQEN